MRKIAIKGHTIVYRGERMSDPTEGRPFKVPDSHWFKLPTPERDNIDTNKLTQWWCGCTRKKDIYKWWRKFEFKHHPEDFIIRVLAVPKDKVVKGNTQCIFDRVIAKEIGILTKNGTICRTYNT